MCVFTLQFDLLLRETTIRYPLRVAPLSAPLSLYVISLAFLLKHLNALEHSYIYITIRILFT